MLRLTTMSSTTKPVWNLLPLVLMSGFAVAWLLRDLAGLDSRYRD
jgi:hypothetical protein